ncbi:MAG: oligosaccharide flippase family protein [Candidatus Peribacteraceae bacterium]
MTEFAPETPAVHVRGSVKKIAASTLWQIASQLTMAAMSIVTIKCVAIGLSKELAGDYNTSYGFLQLFGILADFGLYAIAVREISKAKDRSRTMSVFFLLRLVTVIVALSAALAIAWATPHWRGTPLPLAISIAALVPLFTLLGGILRSAFQVNYRMQFVFVAEVAQRVLTFSLIGLFILLGVRGTSDPRILFAFLLIGGAGALVYLTLSVILSHRLIPLRMHWDPSLMRRIAREAAPFGLAYLCIALYRQFDITLIAQLRPQDFELQNAYYGFVQRMMDMAYILPTFLLNSTLPILSERAARGGETRHLLGRVFLAILLLSSTMFLFASQWPVPLVRLLTTQAYLSTSAAPGSDTALWILSASMFLNGIVLFSFYVLLTANRWKSLLLTLGAGAILSLASNLLLIPILGFVGAAITSVCVHAFLAIALLPWALSAMPIRLPRVAWLQWIAFSLLLAAFLIFAKPFLSTPYHTFLIGGLSGAWMLLVLWVIRVRKTFSM